MGNRITSVRIKRSDGTYSSEIPISPSADKVIWKDNQHNLEQILGEVNTNKTIQNQINQKVNTAELQEYIDQELANDVGDWLEEHVVIPSGGTVAVDDTLSISQAAADSKTVGDIIDQSIAPKFSSIINYKKDDCVFYENHLYKFVTDHVAGAWNATHVEVADNLAKQLDQLKEDLTQEITAINNLDNKLYISGEWQRGTLNIDGSPSTTENNKRIHLVNKIMLYRPITIAIEEGYRFIVYYYTSSSSKYCDSSRSDSGTSGWVSESGSYTIESGTWIDILISKTTESGSYTADINTFKKAIFESNDSLLRQKTLENEANISDLQTIVNSIDNAEYHYITGEWQRGTLTVDGNPDPNGNNKRIILANKIQLSHPTTITIEEGYRFIVYYFASSSSTYKDTTRTDGGTSGWITTSGAYTIEANVWINVLISKISETGEYTADIDTFKRAIYEDSEIISIINKNSADIEELKHKGELPSYWTTHLDGKHNDIVDAITSVGNHGDVFVFFTDYHYKNSDWHYKGFNCLSDILKYVGIRKIIFGGDILDTHTKTEAISILEQFVKDFKDFDIYVVFGNHETNPYASDANDKLSLDDVYSLIYRPLGMENKTKLNPNMYFYFDNEVQKIRYICLNTYDAYNEWDSDTAQHQWFIDTLENMPSGYSVVVIPHIYFYISNGSLAETTLGLEIKALLDAYVDRGQSTWKSQSYDFSDCDGDVVCILAGHTHNDGYVTSTKGYPIIGTVCDAVWGAEQTVTRGSSAMNTYKEHAFDIVCIDTTARTINCVRIGSGSNRTFAY